MSNALGLHWLRHHPDDARDFDFIRRLRPASVKVFEWSYNNQNFCNQLLAAVPGDCIFLARSHPRSEQKEDMYRDPIGTGRRHAQEWVRDLNSGQCWLPRERTYFLGINEPDSNAYRDAVNQYTVAFLDELRANGLKGAAFNFSTGHPRTVDGTGNTAPDYAFYEASHQAIVRGGHIAIQHIYGSADEPCVPGHYDRLSACPWGDVTWVIGEAGIDQHVTTGGAHDGYLIALKPPQAYPGWLERAIRGTADARIHSWMPFTYDFSHPWSSFDVREVNDAFLAWNWQGYDPGSGVPVPQPPQPEPPVTARLTHPVQGARITQHWGENGENYARFGLWGHNGTDFGAAQGTPIKCLADGVVAWVGDDPAYGRYARVYHETLGIFSFYAHMHMLSVTQGQKVTRGQTLGQVGNTGNSSGPHLHFEVRDANPDGSYNPLSPMPKGRLDPESWCCLHGLKL